MIAVFASVKCEDGKVRAESFLLTDEEATELRGKDTDRVRPWTWIVAASGFAHDAYQDNNHYARWWWDEWERRERGEEKQQYEPDAREWYRSDCPRCPWCNAANDIPDDVSDGHPHEEEATCYSCDQPFVIRRSYVYSTAPIRKD